MKQIFEIIILFKDFTCDQKSKTPKDINDNFIQHIHQHNDIFIDWVENKLLNNDEYTKIMKLLYTLNLQICLQFNTDYLMSAALRQSFEKLNSHLITNSNIFL